MAKPCKHCGGVNHASFSCFQKPQKPPKARKPMRQRGKVADAWEKCRAEWFKLHPAKWYTCSLRISPQCPGATRPEQTTLDHIISRSSRPDLRFDHDNLQPACWPCNTMKGSRKMSDFVA